MAEQNQYGTTVDDMGKAEARHMGQSFLLNNYCFMHPSLGAATLDYFKTRTHQVAMPKDEVNNPTKTAEICVICHTKYELEETIGTLRHVLMVLGQVINKCCFCSYKNLHNTPYRELTRPIEHPPWLIPSISHFWRLYFIMNVKWEKGAGGIIQIFPRKGDVWALYMHWFTKWNDLTPNNTMHNYDIVEDTQPNHNIAFQAQKLSRGCGGSINEGAASPLEVEDFIQILVTLNFSYQASDELPQVHLQ
ncbi:hypothetical protein RDI58_024690 [Solanum bulbocastanum]|uniref:DUF3444 domain-containing protein n=1 Tax=Solanum bulbocastanum TaxID=147425 RepID=A0AAN8Y3P3_SOLBU